MNTNTSVKAVRILGNLERAYTHESHVFPTSTETDGQSVLFYSLRVTSFCR